MDPLSMIVASFVLVYFFKRLPETIADIVAAAKNESTARADARLKRLADAGIDPATGGPARQYLANAWRDAWLDAEAKRLAKRAKTRAGPPPRSRFAAWRKRMAARATAEATRRVDRWRNPYTPDDEVSGPTGSRPDGGGGGASGDAGRPVAGADDVPHRPGPPPTTGEVPPLVIVTYDEGQDIYDDEPPVTAVEEPPSASFVDEPTTDDSSPWATSVTADRSPIRLGDVTPNRLPNSNPGRAGTTALAIAAKPIEGEVMTNAVGVAVSGATSGGSQARRIAAWLEAANAAYVAELSRIRAAINAAGIDTLAVVQMDNRSVVVNQLAQCAEAAAAAQGAANNCGSEVVPLLHTVARSFDQLRDN